VREKNQTLHPEGTLVLQYKNILYHQTASCPNLGEFRIKFKEENVVENKKESTQIDEINWRRMMNGKMKEKRNHLHELANGCKRKPTARRS
jgi:hypothetical protein